jgi:hypothetical protein
MVVLKIVDEDIADKVDTHFVSSQFTGLENIGMVFICLREGEEDKDYVEEGIHFIVINLPYEEVRKMQDARPMMLAKAKERLGLRA